jgi:3-phenylpropionate/trans-cinnamate dioxygenase ferredoxin reductase subunit
MATSPVFAIIGASTAGAYAGHALRKEGFDGRILLIGAEKEFPYARPPLTKQYLEGKYERKRLFLWPENSYEELEIEVMLGSRVTRILPAEKHVELQDGRRMGVDKILIATGMIPRKLQFLAEFPNVHYLRTLSDCDAILRSCEHASAAAIIGGGFIGMEVAASLRQNGIDVTIILREQVALEHAIGAEAGEILMNIHRRQGVTFYPAATVASIEGDARAQRVRLESGETIDCEVIIIGAGVMPALDAIQGLDINTDHGIRVDEFCKTSVEHIFAAGDVTNFYHPTLGRHLHVEHWDNARLQGIAAAHNMLGRREAYQPIPFFWSDQYLDIQYAGFPVSWKKTVFRGNIEEEDFSVFMLEGGRLIAAVSFGRWKERRACERILREGIELPPERLSDEAYNLESAPAEV